MDCRRTIREIIDSIYEVYSRAGKNITKEIFYQVLAREFEKRQISFRPVNTKVDKGGQGFIVEKKIIISINSIKSQSCYYQREGFYYLNNSHYKLVLVVNFASNKLHIDPINLEHPQVVTCN